MALGESMSSRSFEVRCAKCDVTFPVETKRCVHCGGSTGAGGLISFGSRPGTASPTGYPSEEDAIESAYGMDADEFIIRHESGAAGGGTGTEDASPGPGRSLLKSMGGVIWILLLVGFSLARSCGGG